MHHYHGRRRRVLHEAGFPSAGRVNTALENFLRRAARPTIRRGLALYLGAESREAGRRAPLFPPFGRGGT